VTTYAIVFKGELRDGFVRDAVMAAFKERANLNEKQIEQVFSGRKVTLKKGLTRDGAKQFARDLRAIGMRIIAATEGGTPAPAEQPAPGTHSIYFAGQVIEGFDAEAVKLVAAKRLKFSERQADLLFAGKEVAMKRGLDEKKARHYADTLRKLGMDIRVDPPLPEVPVDERVNAAEASLLQTQLAPAAPYNFEETFHCSSTLEMLHQETSGEEPMTGIHPSLVAAVPDPQTAHTTTNSHQYVATVVNHDVVSHYADQLREADPDPELEALRAAHDTADPAEPRNVPPEPTLPDGKINSPFDPPPEPAPEKAKPAKAEPVEPPQEKALPAIEPTLPPAAVRGRATESLMPPDNDPELANIAQRAEEKRKWIMAGGFVLIVAIIAVWALL